MSTFNLKKNKQRHLADMKTLDEIHKANISNFKKNKEQLPIKQNKVQMLTTRLYILEQGNFEKFSDEDIKMRANIKNDIKKLQEEIYNIENNIDEAEYYSKTVDTILDYYEQDVMEISVDSNTIKISSGEDKPLDSLDLLNLQNRSAKKVKRVVKKRNVTNTRNNKPTIMSFFGESLKTNAPEKDKSAILDKYKMLVENEYVYDKNKISGYFKKCPDCNIDYVLDQSEGMYVCVNCGSVEMIIIEAEKPSYKEVSTDKPGYPYKRINHFNEWLSQFQAKESSVIPNDVYTLIKKELYKNRITDFKKVKPKTIKDTLKKLGLTNYYEHKTHIISKLSGLPPPIIDRETEDTLRRMFKQIQLPFEKHRPQDRTNFLSYAFVLHKFSELLELDEFTKCFPLLKSTDKLRIQDKIWKDICFELKWEFIPSI